MSFIKSDETRDGGLVGELERSDEAVGEESLADILRLHGSTPGGGGAG
jgi:hypothetical protein